MCNLTPEKELFTKVSNIMKEGNLSGEIDTNPQGKVEILIEWGDWKHEHAYLKYLMNKNGFVHIGTEVTEEDGSDCYSARHIFQTFAEYIKTRKAQFLSNNANYQTARV